MESGKWEWEGWEDVKDCGLCRGAGVFSAVQRAFDCHSAALEDVGVDHGGFDVFVPEEFLDGADVVAVLEEVGGEGVAEGVGGDGFLDAGFLGGGADGFLEEAGVEVVAADPSSVLPKFNFRIWGGSCLAGVAGEGGGGEEVLPDEFAGGVWVFAGEGVGKPDFAESVCEVGLVDALDGSDLALEVGDEGVGEDGDAVVFAFAVADDDLAVAEVYVFDAEADAFHEAESAAVEDFCHELGDAAHVGDEGAGFGRGEDDGEGFGFFGADDVGGRVNFDLEDMTVEEEDGAECLVLGGGGDVFFDGEVGDEGLDFGGAHVFGVAFVVEEDVAFDPVFVGLFGAVGVVFGADGGGDEVHEFWGMLLHC